MPSHSTPLPDLDALALLIAVAETGSLGRAATRSGITQPAASLRMRSLEQQIGLTLLQRSPSGSSLTPAGRKVVEWARPVVQSAADFTRKTTELAQSGQELVRIASSLSIADHLLPGWLSALQAALPRLRVSLQPVNSEHVVKLVADGDVELGFVEGADTPVGVRSRVVREDSLVLVVSPTHPWSRRRAGISAAELAAGPLVLREPGSGTREVLDRALSRHGLSVRPSLELGSTASITSTVAAGTAGAVLSRLAVSADLASGALVMVPTPDLDLRRQLRAVWREGRHPSGAAGALLAIALSPAAPNAR